MRKFFVIAIPVVSLILFVLVMQSGNFLKRPFGTDDNIPEIIEEIMEDVMVENWDEVETGISKLETAWGKVVRRIQFSVERDEINFFTANLARLRGAILAKEKSGALMELKEAYIHWENLGK